MARTMNTAKLAQNGFWRKRLVTVFRINSIYLRARVAETLFCRIAKGNKYSVENGCEIPRATRP